MIKKKELNAPKREMKLKDNPEFKEFIKEIEKNILKGFVLYPKIGKWEVVGIIRSKAGDLK